MLCKKSSSQRGGNATRNMAQNEVMQVVRQHINCLPGAMEHNILKVFRLKAQIRHTDRHNDSIPFKKIHHGNLIQTQQADSVEGENTPVDVVNPNKVSVPIT